LIHIRPECALNRLKISLVAIRRQLHARRQPGCHVLNKPLCAFAIAPSDKVGDYQLAIGVNAGPSPQIATAIGCSLRAGDVLFLGVAEAPDFIALNTLRFDAAHLRIMERFTEAARVFQKLGHGVYAHVAHAGD
jgi:hypothetical protein